MSGHQTKLTMDDIDPSDLPDYDDVANMIAIDDVDKKEANETELQSLKITNEGPKQTQTQKQSTKHTNEPSVSVSESRMGALTKLTSMGYTNMQANNALNAVKDYAPNNTAMAVEWIMDHSENDNTNTTAKRTVSDLMDGPNTTQMQPMQVESANTNTNTNTNANTDDNAQVDYKEKCMECLDSTRVFCGDCWNNSETKYNNMSDTEKRVCWGFSGFFCCFGMLLTVILIPMSLRKVEFDEFAIKYDGLTREEDSEEYGEGRYIFTPRTEMFIYDALIQKLSLNLSTLTWDGILMQIEVDIQYSIPQTSVYEIWDEFGKENNIDKYFALVAADSVRDVIGSFKASAFYRNRFGIQIAIEDSLIEAMETGKTHLILTSAVLAGYTYPELLSAVIKEKRAVENDIEVAHNERNGNLTDADTNYEVSKVTAERILIQGQAEVESLMAESEALANAIGARFENIRNLFFDMKVIHNFTAHEFIDYWLTAFVLFDATRPLTTTIFPGSEYTPTPSPVFIPVTTEVIGNETETTLMTSTTSAAQTTEYFTSVVPSVSPLPSP